MENKYAHIPQEKFAFAQKDAVLHDTKFDTKARSYFADALIRFKKNKSSVVAAYIILFLVILQTGKSHKVLSKSSHYFLRFQVITTVMKVNDMKVYFQLIV